MKKLFLILFCAAFFGTCAFFSLGMLFPGTVGAEEGAEAPALIVDGAVNGDFGDMFEDYFSKSFALRSRVVSAFSALREKLFATGNDQVTVGRDGFLFFNEALDDFTGEAAMSDAEIAAAAQSLKALSDYACGRGSEFIFVCAPSKATIYPEMLPARIRAAEVSDLDRLYAELDRLGVRYVDLRPALLSAKEGTLIYHKRDSHWNGRGAFVAFGEVLRALGCEVPDFGAFAASEDFEGDLDRLLYPGELRYDRDEAQSFEGRYIYTAPVTTPMDMVISTRSAAAGRILMFRDSFANALIGYVASAFGEARLERANPYRIDALATFNADVTIVEIAERNLRDLIGSQARVD